MPFPPAAPPSIFRFDRLHPSRVPPPARNRAGGARSRRGATAHGERTREASRRGTNDDLPTAPARGNHFSSGKISDGFKILVVSYQTEIVLVRGNKSKIQHTVLFQFGGGKDRAGGNERAKPLSAGPMTAAPPRGDGRDGRGVALFLFSGRRRSRSGGGARGECQNVPC